MPHFCVMVGVRFACVRSAEQRSKGTKRMIVSQQIILQDSRRRRRIDEYGKEADGSQTVDCRGNELRGVLSGKGNRAGGRNDTH